MALDRESSSSSLQSVVTAVHHDSRRTSRTNRGSSNSAGYLAGQRLAEQRNSLRNSVVALTAARAAEGGSGRSSSAETSSDQRRHSKQEVSRIYSKRRMATNINARNNSENESSEGPGAGDAGNGEDLEVHQPNKGMKKIGARATEIRMQQECTCNRKWLRHYPISYAHPHPLS